MLGEGILIAIVQALRAFKQAHLSRLGSRQLGHFTLIQSHFDPEDR
jgi:hypothetical protein